MKADHLSMRCAGKGCERNITVPIHLLSEPSALAKRTSAIGWCLVSYTVTDERVSAFEAMALYCERCGREVMSEGGVRCLDEKEAKRRRNMS